MDKTQMVLRVLLFAMAVAVTIICAWGWWRRPRDRAYCVALASYFLHVVVFYGVLLLHAVDNPLSLNLWSGALRLHEMILALAGSWLFLGPGRKRS